MRRQRINRRSLWHALKSAGDLSGRFLYGAEASIALNELIAGTMLYGRGAELCGRSVLLMTTNQFTTASAVIELDGVAQRMVLCPPDLPLEYLPYVIDTAEVDAIVSDRAMFALGGSRHMIYCPCSREIEPSNYDRTVQHQTEWILLTSGTTGAPKLVAHTLESLSGAIEADGDKQEPEVWSTFYDIRRYGGLQILLRAALGGRSLVMASGHEATGDFLTRAGAHGVTHISGTPTQWRRALMSPAAHLITPNYVRLSGEIVDQGILSRLRAAYPQARILHAFASTEAGVAFEVKDEQAGFPAETIARTPQVEMKVEDGSLRIRSARTASRYLGANAPALKDEDGFVDTGDMVEQRNGRYSFVGRRDGMINVGGLKVYPEEVEAVINRHPEVQVSLVRTKKSSVSGSLVVADVVLKTAAHSGGRDMHAIQNDIVLICRESLSPYKVPAAINIVSTLAVAESGKMIRGNA